MIAVTGLMRSGTSPLAMMLHQMGVTMGTYQRFPLHNEKAHFEWEDAALADPLLKIISTFAGPPKSESEVLTDTQADELADAPSDLLRSYVGKRRDAAQGKPWGVKTPFLLPYVDDLRSVCEELGEPLTVCVTQRKMLQTFESMWDQTAHIHDPVERKSVFDHLSYIQYALETEWKAASEGAVIFDFEETRERPRDIARRLARLAGVEIDVDLATRGILVGGL